MQRRYTVDGVGSFYAQVRHVDLTVVDDGHLLSQSRFIGIGLHQVDVLTSVDFCYDGVDSGQSFFEHTFRPLFQSFRHDGVVGVRNGLSYDIPSLIPIVIINVDQDSHQFRNRHGGMGIVDVDRDLVSEVIQSTVSSHVTLVYGL